MAVRFTLTLISGLLIAAHFLRAGTYPLVLIGLAFPFLLFVKKSWADRVVQVLLVLAAARWVQTMLQLIEFRQLTGQPWTRMAIILGAVALFNLAAVWAVNPKKSAQ